MSLKNSPILKSSKIRVGITIGDPSGIGPAITLEAVRKLRGLADFVIIGDAGVLDKVIRPQDHKVARFKFVELNNINHRYFKFGKISAEYARASIEYLDKALELLRTKEIDCLVTAPISKEAVALSGIKNFSGHTGYLVQKTGVSGHTMLLLNKYLKISLLTEHTSLKGVSPQLTPGGLRKNILLTHSSLKKLFLLKDPRLVVCGLNPHASDNGLFGIEENSIIKPALNKLRTKIRNLDGPLSADVALEKLKDGYYDCAIAMYHDQALIALKILSSETGVNMTLGLPFVRTSPLHGTAFDIAKTPHLVKASSMIEAVKLALKCSQNLKKD